MFFNFKNNDNNIKYKNKYKTILKNIKCNGSSEYDLSKVLITIRIIIEYLNYSKALYTLENSEFKTRNLLSIYRKLQNEISGLYNNECKFESYEKEANKILCIKKFQSLYMLQI